MRISSWSSYVCSSDLGSSTPAERKMASVRVNSPMPQEPIRLRKLLSYGPREYDPQAIGDEHSMHHGCRYDRRPVPVSPAVPLVAPYRPRRSKFQPWGFRRSDMPRSFRRPATARRRPDVHRSEEHTSEHTSLLRITYAVSCLKKK